MFKELLLCIFGCLLLSLTNASVTGYIRPVDQTRYLQVLEEGLISEEASNIHYASLGYKLLSKQIPADKANKACKSLQSTVTIDAKPELFYHISSALRNLESCKFTFKDSDLKVTRDVLVDATSSLPDIHYSVATLKNMGKPIDNAVKIVQTLQTRLKTEDTLQNLGHTFHIAALLGDAGKFAYDRIEEALVQADEVDGKLLQFEGGLSVTSLILVGIDKLSVSQNKKSIITQQQAEKFSNYLITRRSVQSVKGVSSLLEAVLVFTNNKELSPASISLAGSSHLTSAVTIRICDLLGRPLNLPADSIVAQSATRLGDDVVVLSKQKLTITPDSTLYNLDLPRDRMAAGLYRVAISAGSHTASLTVTALANGAINYLDIGVADADQVASGKMQRLKYPNELNVVLEADSQQRLTIRFSFIDTATNKPLTVQQAFIRLSCVKSGQEIIFVAEQDDSSVYRLDLDIGSKASQFGGQSGTFNIDLILGDTILSKPLQWHIGKIELKLHGTSQSEISRLSGPKPEIQHMFREAEKRPPQFLSMLFTGLAAFPILILLGLWFELGINVSNFTFSIGALGFYFGLAGILGLFSIFWLSLDMFQTSKWLLLLGLITFLSGHRLLSSIAEKRKH